jgi:hypothetical protein
MIKDREPYISVGTVENETGQVVSHELEITKDGLTYSVTVSTPNHADKIKQHNLKIPDPDAQLFDNFLRINDIKDLKDPKQVYQRLSSMPFANLKPYLTPLTPNPADPKS